MIGKSQWREYIWDTGVTPLICMRNAMGFLTTESRPWLNFSFNEWCY